MPDLMPPAQPLFNLHVIESRLPTDTSRVVITDSVRFGTLEPGHLGGSRITSTHFPGGHSTLHIKAVPTSPKERAAAQALADAIAGSGLLSQLRPAPGIGAPAPGLTRIYIDRRSRFIEFENGKAPAPAQAVLDALAAYRRG